MKTKERYPEMKIIKTNFIVIIVRVSLGVKLSLCTYKLYAKQHHRFYKANSIFGLRIQNVQSSSEGFRWLSIQLVCCIADI